MIFSNLLKKSGFALETIYVAAILIVVICSHQAIANEEDDVKMIYAHQQALVSMCRKHQLAKLELQEALRNDKNSHIPNQKIIKIPSVCFNLLADDTDFGSDRPLQYLNWHFDNNQDNDLNNDNAAEKDNKSSKTNMLQKVLEKVFFNINKHDEKQNNTDDNDEHLKQLHEAERRLLESDEFNKIIDTNRDKLAKYLSPVVLIPGLAGSRLEARLNKSKSTNLFCDKQTSWKNIWLSIRSLLPFFVDCWLDNIRLVVNPQTGTTRNAAGVQIRVADFGQVKSVEVLDISHPDSTEYFKPLIDRYEALGYTRDVNLLAAPYDFRLAANELADWFEAIKNLVESLVSESPSGKRATLVCHSMGCLNTLIFLRQQSAEWRATNIRKLIALAAPWGGAIKAVKALVVGDTYDLPLVSDAKLRGIMRTFPSVAYLLPDSQVFEATSWRRALPGGPVMVQTPEFAYKVRDLPKLLDDLNLTQHIKWHEEFAALISPLEPLTDVQVDCIHSLNIPTPEKLFFAKSQDFPNGDYTLINSDGDGTVNAESLLVCERWRALQPSLVKHTIIQNTDHSGVLSHPVTLTHIADDVLDATD